MPQIAEAAEMANGCAAERKRVAFSEVAWIFMFSKTLLPQICMWTPVWCSSPQALQSAVSNFCRGRSAYKQLAPQILHRSPTGCNMFGCRLHCMVPSKSLRHALGGLSEASICSKRAWLCELDGVEVKIDLPSAPCDAGFTLRLPRDRGVYSPSHRVEDY